MISQIIRGARIFPKGKINDPLRCMLVDSWYDSYLGVVVLVRVIDGQLKKNQKIRFIAAGVTHTIDRVGIFSPKPTETERLPSGSAELSRSVHIS